MKQLSDRTLCAGIDVGGTSVKFGLFRTDGTLLKKWSVPTRRTADGESILRDIAASLRDFLDGEGIALSELCGAGMGIPAPVLPGGFVKSCANLGFRNMKPAEILSGLLDGLPVRCENDANAAALGEAWQGSGKNRSDLVLITLGTGIGGGVILGGKIRTGKTGLAGEFGHIHVLEDESEACGCGGMGCLEQVSSATGIVRTAGRLLNGGERESVLRGANPLTAKAVIDAAKAGDALANEAVDRACRYLAFVMAGITMAIEPEAFLIGGGLSAAGDWLTDRIRSHYAHFTPLLSEKTPILLASLGNDAGIYGAARLVCG